MKKTEYEKMSREHRKALFEKKMLPTWERRYRADDVRMTLKELRLLAQKADASKWWPTREQVMERLGLTGGRSDDWRVRDKLEKILEAAIRERRR